MPGSLLSGATGQKLVTLIRANFISAGSNVTIVSRDERGTFLRRKPDPSAGFCVRYDDWWSTYYRAPSGDNYWKDWCQRVIRFTFNPRTRTISDYLAYRVWSGPTNYREDENGNPVSPPFDFWFTPTGIAVARLLVDLGIAGRAPSQTPFHVSIGLQMFREMAPREFGEGGPVGHDTAVGGETDSIPLVMWVCWNSPNPDYLL